MNREDYDEWVEDSYTDVPLPDLGTSTYEENAVSEWEGSKSKGREEWQARGRGGRGGGRSFAPRNTDNSWEEKRDETAWNDSHSFKNDDFSGRRARGGGRGQSFCQQDSDGNRTDGWENSRGEWEGTGGGQRRSEGGDSRFSQRGDRRRGRGASSGNNTWGESENVERSSREEGEDSCRRGRGGSRGRGGGFRTSEEPDGRVDTQGEEKPTERYIPPEPTNDENVVFGSNISSGINFSKYDAIQIKVTGENVPQPVSSFEDCQLRKLLIDNIKKSGYTKPTPVQKYALPIICDGRDLMACAQTGSGKTAAFLLPILDNLLEKSPPADPGRPILPQVVICSPTRELSIQIFNEARKFAYGSSIKICIAYGGTVISHQAQNISRGCNVLVGTPGRLNDFVDRKVIEFSGVEYFVLDEADRMLDMGFLPAIEKMLHHETMTPLGERQTLMFSATFPEDIQRLAATHLNNYLFLAVGIVGGACADVEQVFYEVSKFEKRTKLVDILREHSATEKELTLVFVEQKRNADFIAAFLCENRFPTTSIHGDRLQSQREEALRDFKAGRRPILVATAVAARGLDIKNVAHVVNFDLPKTIDEYVHRIGRTGRVGNRGRATSLYDSSVDSPLAPQLLKILEQTGQEKPSFLVDSGYNNSVTKSFGDEFGGEDVRGESFAAVNRVPRQIEQEEVW